MRLIHKKVTGGGAWMDYTMIEKASNLKAEHQGLKHAKDQDNLTNWALLLAKVPWKETAPPKA